MTGSSDDPAPNNGVPTAATGDSHFSKLYSTPPNFKELARQDPQFAALWHEKKSDFFNDPRCVMQLTRTLLKLDFGLEIELRDDRLCPPVTNRHNYILWLKGLMDTTSDGSPDRKLVGLDIGTGASCIYPLLGCAQRPWDFIATDIDADSVEAAKNNVRLNNLESRISVVHVKAEDPPIPLDHLDLPAIDFTMTNPPFYESAQEMVESANKKSRPPFTACTGAEVEMVTPGGEVAFVDRIFQESLVLRERVQWYTSMFGFLTSLIDFVEKLHQNGINNYAVTEFVQGSKTRRWAVAWSFGTMRPSPEVARGMKALTTKSVLPAATEAEVISLPLPEHIGAFADGLAAAVSRLALISWSWDGRRLEGTGRAADKVWARAWRRRKKRELDTGNADDKSVKTEDPKCILGFRVYIRVGTENVSVWCRWLEGHDAVIFESFQGFVKTTVRGILNSQE